MAQYENDHRPVGTWVPNKDFQALQRLASASGVSVAVYLRAIIVDAINDEEELSSSKVRAASV